MTHDMTTIVQPINLLVSDELDRASKLHGKTFASTHEGFGVIAEELQEVGDELEIVEGYLSTMLTFIRDEDKQRIVDVADCLRDRAVNAAAELIQVAAMCEKMTRTVREA
jgi:hypothetical protein